MYLLWQMNYAFWANFHRCKPIFHSRRKNSIWIIVKHVERPQRGWTSTSKLPQVKQNFLLTTNDIQTEHTTPGIGFQLDNQRGLAFWYRKRRRFSEWTRPIKISFTISVQNFVWTCGRPRGCGCERGRRRGWGRGRWQDFCVCCLIRKKWKHFQKQENKI